MIHHEGPEEKAFEELSHQVIGCAIEVHRAIGVHLSTMPQS